MKLSFIRAVFSLFINHHPVKNIVYNLSTETLFNSCRAAINGKHQALPGLKLRWQGKGVPYMPKK